MSVTVRQLLAIDGLALQLLAGEAATDRDIRWVHTSELEDPTPWLKGGELLLTTGMHVGETPAKQKAYVKRLAAANLAGLGLSAGFTWDRVPKAMVKAAAELDFPLFEVPYPVPFLAITEAMASRILAEQYDVLQRAVDAQHALTRAVLDEEGLQGIADSLAKALKGWTLVLDLHGISLASTSTAASKRAARVWEELQTSRPEGTGFSLTLVDGGHHVWIQPVGAHGRVEAFLAVGKPQAALSPFDRIVAGHALSLLAIELGKERAVADAQRRLQGDLFQELVAGTVAPATATKTLGRFGFPAQAPVVVLVAETAERADMTAGIAKDIAWAAEDHLSRGGQAYLVSPAAESVRLMIPADEAAAEALIRDKVGKRAKVDLRVGASSPVALTDVARGLREAHYALQVCRLEGWTSAGFEDLGTYRLLLSMADPDALRAFADSLLAPLDVYDQDNNGELVHSLRVFLEDNARWETASATLGVHRHTLRYRMRKAEELTGRDLSSSFDRMEFWLAVRARELQGAQLD